MHAVTYVTGRVFEQAGYTLKAAHCSFMHDKCQATEASTPQLPTSQQKQTHACILMVWSFTHRGRLG